MSTEALPLEVVTPEEQKELLAVVQQNGLPAEAAQSLQVSFAGAFTEARKILVQSSAIVVTDSSQKLQIKLAREYRLGLKEIRVAADKLRKELKQDSLNRSRAIDGFYNILLHLTDTEETRLAEQEQFAERQEAAKKAALKAEREKIVAALSIDPNLYQLGEMSDETFNTLVEGTKLARAAQETARVKAEADRIAKEAADAAERERIRLENEQLKKEAEEREAAAKAERERAAAEAARLKAEADEAARLAAEYARKDREALEAKAKAAAEAAATRLAEERKKAELAAEQARKEREAADAKAKLVREAAEADAKAERDAREKIEAELRAAREAEAARIAAEEAARKQAAAAPDKEKLAALAASIRALVVPELTTLEAVTLVSEIETQREKFALWIEKRAAAL